MTPCGLHVVSLGYQRVSLSKKVITRYIVLHYSDRTSMVQGSYMFYAVKAVTRKGYIRHATGPGIPLCL